MKTRYPPVLTPTAAAPGHLEDAVAMVSRCHEFGEGWVPEEGVVWKETVSNVEVDELCAVVVELGKGDGETNLPYGVGRAISHS